MPPRARPPLRRPGAGTADLTPPQYTFCLAYLANGFKARPAYMASHPKATIATAGVEGHRTLHLPKVQAYLAPYIEAHWKTLQMTGDEALARVALDARSDPRQLFGADGLALHPKDWPDELANSIESVEFTKDGTWKVKFASKVQSRHTILEQTGKLRSAADSFDALAEAIRADQSRRKPAS